MAIKKIEHLSLSLMAYIFHNVGWLELDTEDT